MINFRSSLNNFFGRIRYFLARCRLRILKVCALTPGHWRWAARAILIMMALFMAGMAIDFVGELHMGIFLAALLFFPGLALLAGLGARLGIKILKLLPEKQSWIFFGAVFFVLFFFGLPGKAMVVMMLFLILSGSFLGAGIYNLTGGRWSLLSRARRVLSMAFISLGASLFISGAFIMLYPGKGSP